MTFDEWVRTLTWEKEPGFSVLTGHNGEHEFARIVWEAGYAQGEKDGTDDLKQTLKDRQ